MKNCALALVSHVVKHKCYLLRNSLCNSVEVMYGLAKWDWTMLTDVKWTATGTRVRVYNLSNFNQYSILNCAWNHLHPPENGQN